MKTFKVMLTLRAECESDARELLEDYTGRETDLEISEVTEAEDMEGKEEIISAVKKALETQFEGYSWDTMIDDIASCLAWTDEQIKWAKQHLYPDVRSVPYREYQAVGSR